MAISAYIQAPHDVQDYAVNWTLNPGDTITASTWVADNAGIVVGTNSFINTPTPQTFARLSSAGGLVGTYSAVNVVNHVTTTQGAQHDHTITIYLLGGLT